MSKIKTVRAQEILNSRGVPTVLTRVHTSTGHVGKCAVPSGASTGSQEAHELRDGDERFNGLGVREAVMNVNAKIADAVSGKNIGKQRAIDLEMIELDDTDNKSRLGANAILSVSIALAKAVAAERGITLADYLRKEYTNNSNLGKPLILANMINGGAHADTRMPIQEFLLMAERKEPNVVIEQLFAVADRLRAQVTETFDSPVVGVGDEGGLVLPSAEPAKALSLLAKITENYDFTLGIDVAASEFYNEGRYKYAGETLTQEGLQKILHSYVRDYPLQYIEDPFLDTDFQAHASLNNAVNAEVVGDDLTTTSKERIHTAVQSESIDAVIIKPNQIGTLTETIEAIEAANENGLHCYASHRSGETNDPFIVDIAAGLDCHGVKIGALQRGERISKYNRLRKLHEETAN